MGHQLRKSFMILLAPQNQEAGAATFREYERTITNSLADSPTAVRTFFGVEEE